MTKEECAKQIKEMIDRDIERLFEDDGAVYHKDNLQMTLSRIACFAFDLGGYFEHKRLLTKCEEKGLAWPL